MNTPVNIALAQLNFTVGDIDGNTLKISNYYAEAVKQQADLVIFTELAITGYPPEDLVLNSYFQETIGRALEKLAAQTLNQPTAMLIGSIARSDARLYNAAFFIENGQVTEIIGKHTLPNYGVFDERRLFTPAELAMPVYLHDIKLGIMICEDIWVEEVIAHYAHHGAELIICINSSPFHQDKYHTRIGIVREHCKKHALPVIYVNQIGGQDNLVFDGGSFIMNENGLITAQMSFFTEEIAFSLWHKNNAKLSHDPVESVIIPGRESFIYQALVLGLRDYVSKNRFDKVILGLSGGIDSALTAAIAVDALGPDKVKCVMLPFIYTSEASIEDAKACAKLLGVELECIIIEECVYSVEKVLAPVFASNKKDITEENIQARIRGILLMALSNKFGYLVLTTGNKSELATGYATLYGDMCGGYNVLKDVYKTEVYELSNWRNHNLPDIALGSKGQVIPDAILTKAPTAELRYNQLDQDSLPPYSLLDKILFELIECNMSIKEIVAKGYTQKDVEQVSKLLYQAEYKRRQGAPGPKISTMSFGNDRRYPITNKWMN